MPQIKEQFLLNVMVLLVYKNVDCEVMSVRRFREHRTQTNEIINTATSGDNNRIMSATSQSSYLKI